MKILTLGIFVLLLNSCDSKPIELDYCKMIAEDQSFVNNDKSNLEQYNLDKSKRKEIIKNNFALIMEKTKQDGFPLVSLNTYSVDSCKYWTITMTMIHIAQSDPELFFSEKYSKIFESELKKGNMERNLLEKASVITAKTIELCEEWKPKIKYATDLWGINYSIFDAAKFIKCK